MSNFISQNEVNEANELLKVQQPHLEMSSEIDKLRCITNTALSPVTEITVTHGSSRFSATIYAEPCRKILQICTNSQRSKTWVMTGGG